MKDWLVGSVVFAPGVPCRVSGFPSAPAAGVPVSVGQSFQFYEDSSFWNEVKYGQRFPCGYDERDAKV